MDDVEQLEKQLDEANKEIERLLGVIRDAKKQFDEI